MADQRAQGRGWRWPKGMLNRIILVASSVGLVRHAWELAGRLFFGRSHSFPQPWGYDVAVRCVLLAFGLALCLVPFSRRRYPLLLGAHVLMILADLLHSTALWLPPPWLACAPAVQSLLSCGGAALFVLALTHGERWDEFALTAPLVLLAALFRLVRGDANVPWPPLLDDEGDGEPGDASQAPRTAEGG